MRSITTIGCAIVALGASLGLARSVTAQWVEEDCVVLLEEVATQQDSLFGFLVEAIGDADKDGVTDFVATSPFYDQGASSLGRVSAHSGADGALFAHISPRMPTAAKPEDIAALAAYLASDEARFVTGSAFTIDGGQVA